MGQGVTAYLSGSFVVMVTVPNSEPETLAQRHASAIGALYMPNGQPTDHPVPGGTVRVTEFADVSEPYAVDGQWIRATLAIPYGVSALRRD